MLQALECEGASFLQLVRACMSKERKKTGGKTWDKSVGSAMFYHMRPALSDRNNG
jgi:hypothetical protein